MTRDTTTLLNDVLRLPDDERLELASRLFAQESSVISAQPGVMSGAPVFKGRECSRKRSSNTLKPAILSTIFSKGFRR